MDLAIALAAAKRHPPNGKFPGAGPARTLVAALLGVGCAVVPMCMFPYEFIVYAKSGFYEMTAPKPESLKSKKEQLDICANYVTLFEKSQDSCVDCRPQLIKLCGIDPDEILKNIRGY